MGKDGGRKRTRQKKKRRNRGDRNNETKKMWRQIGGRSGERVRTERMKDKEKRTKRGGK